MSIAFFDIDGTLLAKPSLERRFFRELHRQRKIPRANYFRWVAKAIRCGLRDFGTAVQANKSYLQNVSADVLSEFARERRPAWLPEIFHPAVQRVCWHALRGDSIVLVSGTLLPIAEIVKFALQRELLGRGIETKIAVIATRLEIRDGHWTGRVCGAPMLGETKALAIKEFARQPGIGLSECSAYGDSSLDRWMLASVGHPFAINPTRRMRRTANLYGWRIRSWASCPARTSGDKRDFETGFEMDPLKAEDEAAR
jgi:HAD superfamily hydrolase (TIGR01490 family)